MRSAFLTTLAALLAATALAAPVSAATPTERRLARQVKTVQAQVKTLQRQVKTLQTQMRNVQSTSAGAIIYSACVTAAVADAFQGTWETIDRHAVLNAHGVEQYPPQTAIADPLNSCQRLEVQRQPNLVPPTTDVFSALLNIFR